MKTWMGFGDLALMFKVTAELNVPNLKQKELVQTSDFSENVTSSIFIN